MAEVPATGTIACACRPCAVRSVIACMLHVQRPQLCMRGSAGGRQAGRRQTGCVFDPPLPQGLPLVCAAPPCMCFLLLEPAMTVIQHSTGIEMEECGGCGVEVG